MNLGYYKDFPADYQIQMYIKKRADLRFFYPDRITYPDRM